MTRAHRPTPPEAASTDLREVLTRLPAANVVLSACPQGFTLGHTVALVDPATLLAPVDLETFATPLSIPVESSEPAVEVSLTRTPAATRDEQPNSPTGDRAASSRADQTASANDVGAAGMAAASATDAPVSTAPPVAPEPLSPDETPPGTTPTSPDPEPLAPISPAPAPEPAPPAPISPAPVSPAPPSPAPGHPVPDDPAPVSPAPGAPAPAGPGLGDDELPSGEALGAEIAAELSAQAPPAAQPAPRRPEAGEWRGVVLVTGTDTDVGKTVVTAAVAAAAQASGLRVAVIKPGQTGIATGAPTDIEVITRLAAPDTTRTLAEYPDPLAPLAAATVASLPPLELYEVVDAIRAEADKHDLVLVEGAGGLLVPMGVRPSGESWTVADLATTLGISAIVVARAGLGTLNHTALTLEALARRGVPAGVVIGAWPGDPELVHWANLSELVPHLIGALPDGAGAMDPGVFRRSAPGWLTPSLYGVLDNWRVWAEEFGEGHH